MLTTKSGVTVVDYRKLTALQRRIQKRRPPLNKQGVEIWARYHDALRAVARRYGKVGWDANVDFYHSGDWFHQLSDGFALLTSRGVTLKALREFQKVVTQHHPDAALSFGGDIDTPIFGLEILVTPSAIYVGWFQNKAVTCRRKLKKLGLNIL